MSETISSAISFLNDSQLSCLHSSIAIISIQLNGFNYCNLISIVLSNIKHLFAHRELGKSVAI